MRLDSGCRGAARRRGRDGVRRRFGRRPGPARSVRRVRHLDRQRVVGADDVRPRRGADRGASGARAPPGPPARPRRGRRRRVRRRLAGGRSGHELGDAPRRPCGPGRRGHTRARRVAPGARHDRRRRATGTAVVGHGRRRRRRRRPGTRWCAHPALRLAGDLRRPGTDRRSGALVVVSDPAARVLRREGELHGRPGTSWRHVVVANIGFALGVRRPRRRPVPRRALGRRGVAVQPDPECRRRRAALPLGMLAGRLAQHAPARVVAAGGAGLLAVGLARPRPAARRAGGSRRGGVLRVRRRVRPRPRGARDAAAVPAAGPAVRASAVSVGARHAGLVLGLVVIAPVLSSSLEAGVERATLGATPRTMLETELPLSDKLPVTWALRTAIEEAPARPGARPRRQSSTTGGARGRPTPWREHVISSTATITDAVTRSFRPAFAVAAGLAALAVVPALLVARHTTTGPQRQRARWSAAGMAGLAVVGVGVIAVELGAGAGGQW